MFQRSVIEQLEARMKEKRNFIQVIAGPRQVGKTTLISQLLGRLDIPSQYISADGAGPQGAIWIEKHWEAARRGLLTAGAGELILVIDEIQKLENWSETVKKLWDEDTWNKIPLKLIISGSSRLLLQEGLTESLGGRFEVTYMGHWTLREMQEAFGWSPEKYVWHGGYPGSASLVDDEMRWKRYLNDSIIETSISRDILMLTRVDKPALLRRLFETGVRYSGMELSYTKVLGQLQDSGNTTTLSHYLSLLGSAGLLSGIEKYSGSIARQRSSSPKFMVHNTALMSSSDAEHFSSIREHPARWGRYVESAVGANLLDGYAKGHYKLYYWRKGNLEVDFVLVRDNHILALEVKSGRIRGRSGLEQFKKEFPHSRVMLIGDSGMPWQEFLKVDMAEII
ncbi:MAG: AAA family ATPase [Bacteroidales bacterium]|jgi:predicted AAA+ superfamily ATPase|nr:AAA family ATPase [Bacteroidales bacterium]